MRIAILSSAVVGAALLVTPAAAQNYYYSSGYRPVYSQQNLIQDLGREFNALFHNLGQLANNAQRMQNGVYAPRYSYSSSYYGAGYGYGNGYGYDSYRYGWPAYGYGYGYDPVRFWKDAAKASEKERRRLAKEAYKAKLRAEAAERALRQSQAR